MECSLVLRDNTFAGMVSLIYTASADYRLRRDIEVVTEDVVGVVARLQLTEAFDCPGRKRIVQTLWAQIGFEAQVESFEMDGDFVPQRIHAFTTCSEGCHCKVSSSVPVGGCVRINV